MTARPLAAATDAELLGRVAAMFDAADPMPADAAGRAVAALAAEPVACTTVRYRCPFCRRYSRSRKAAVADHMTRCWLNPAVRACKTCAHHRQEDAEPDVGLGGFEWCDAQDIQLAGIRAACPLWTLRGSS